MREFENGCPCCGGTLWHLDGCTNDKSGVTVTDQICDDTDEFDEDERCYYCDDAIDAEEHKIRFILDGKKTVCCERCFWQWIEEDKDYEEALMILRNRIHGESTGIPAIDDEEMVDALEAELEEAYYAMLKYDAAMISMRAMRRVAR